MEVMREESDPDAADPLMREAMRAEIDKLPADVKEAAGDALGEPLIEQTVRQFNSAWFRFFLSYDPRPALEAVTVPVLAVFGEKDLQVPPAQSAPEIEAAVHRICQASGRTTVLNGRFRGGWTTRHYGAQDNVHAIQMELAQSSHLAREEPPFDLDPGKCAALRPILSEILHSLSDIIIKGNAR